jgi:hypothetical protein
MKAASIVLTAIAGLVCVHCGTDSSWAPDFSPVSRVDSGTAVAVMLTTYSTTLLANGTDWTKLRIAVTDSMAREITSANDSIRVYVSGDGMITSRDGASLPVLTDTAGVPYAPAKLVDGVSTLAFRAGTSPDRVRVEARSGRLFPGSHEIHTIPGDVELLMPTAERLPSTTKSIDRMIGADISFLPDREQSRVVRRRRREILRGRTGGRCYTATEESWL